MNTTQRKFLVERIQQKVKEKIESLQNKKEKYPSASNYIFKAILNNTLQIQPDEVILSALKEKAMRAKEGANWLSEARMGYEKERTIQLLIEQLIVLPEDYNKELQRVKECNRLIEEQIETLKIQLDAIEVRVQLASDKTLSNLINEVDDMGSLSLIDTKLKLLN